MLEISTVEGLEDVRTASAARPVFIFKHSTTCPVSARAAARMDAYLATPAEGRPEFYLIKVVEFRAVSNAAAVGLGVEHQSPQLILVKGGKGVWSASHYGIQADAIDAAIEQLGAGAGAR